MPDATLLNDLGTLLRTPEPAELGPGSRADTQPLDALNRALDPLLEKIPDRHDAELIRSLVLLWHDHLDTSHTISQGIETGDGSFLHGIMHRREPDYWNSKYWFRRVGNHAAFPAIAKRTAELLAQRGAAKLASQLCPHGAWDAFAFVDAVEAACGRNGTDEQRLLLRKVQQIEFEVLLDHFATRV
ncbi:MAG: hypothetical protein HY300_10305 [Verrucomicrobia bacterium]|nr:hypothetical protein [Verrucomicrobiota bacterium]